MDGGDRGQGQFRVAQVDVGLSRMDADLEKKVNLAVYWARQRVDVPRG
ncbi:hypothetical protein [Actinomadura rugatobispora]|uniref:Uncharacterized protein n=1 Tax=Actinomadura rugatobispora TaxID=1994 RepID=A0ABW1A2D1_9ACTN